MASAATKDLRWAWEGTDRKGTRQKGKTVGASEQAVKAMLRKQGITPIKVKKQRTGGGGKKITAGDIAILSRQMATMMTAGVPLVQSFEIIGRGHDNPKMSELILTVKADIEGGNTLAQALAAHPLYFDDLFVSLVEAGEQAGALETMLDKLATYKEKTEAIKAKIKKALFYPTAVLVVAFIVTAILLIYVVPMFQELFEGFGAELPAFTQFVVNLSEFAQAYWFYAAVGLGGAGWAFIKVKQRSRALRQAIDRYSLKLPVIGDILTKSAIARFARTLSTMFAAGVPLVEALDSVAGATGNIVYEDGTRVMREQVATGTQLQLCMAQSELFPNMVVQMIAIGEESGSLDSMSARVADFYEAEVDNAVDALSSLLEPMIMAILGVLVGGLVVAMYLPIFKMGSVI
ncbi:MAG: type II secretion system F family protein [Gammaproteobacteria bacterium]